MTSNDKQGVEMLGCTLSFLIDAWHFEDKIKAQKYIEKFIKAVQDLQSQGFPKLKHTVTARNEYLPSAGGGQVV